METESTYTLSVDEFFERATATKREYMIWLLKDGTAVAYMSIILFTKPAGNSLVLCDIETRDGHRRQGNASRLMALTAGHFGLPLLTTGSYTPEGLAALKGKLALVPGKTEDTTPSYNSMDFVADWEQRWIQL